MTKSLTPTKKHKKANKKFEYTTIADRHRTVSWSSCSQRPGVVKPVYGIQTFPLTTNAVKSKGHACKNPPYRDQGTTTLDISSYYRFDF